MPSELKLIIWLARRKKPYTVHSMENKDFINFMGKVKKLSILGMKLGGTMMKMKS